MRKSCFQAAFAALVLLDVAAYAQQGQSTAKAPLYNTAKQKLLDGKQVFSFTQSTFNIADYCEKAKHYDYTWFDMQHSVLEFRDVQQMIAACPHVAAIPMIRMPDAQEWHIQHATDIGVLGTITATVDDVDRAREAVKWSHYPPFGRRSTGAGQAASIWGINGIDYHSTINDNFLTVLMIETPTGVANAFDIASVPGVDVVIIGNADLASFSGFKQDDDRYWQLVKKVHDDVIRAGKLFGQANANYSKGEHSYDGRFFQNGPSNDGWVPPNSGRGRGGRGGANPNAPPPGE